jgi:hypothetical protein
MILRSVRPAVAHTCSPPVIARHTLTRDFHPSIAVFEEKSMFGKIGDAVSSGFSSKKEEKQGE